jgi:hypothetical protein
VVAVDVFAASLTSTRLSRIVRASKPDKSAVRVSLKKSNER